MNLAKKTVLTNTAKNKLHVTAQNVEDAMVELHENEPAIGDIKLTTRTITDDRWQLCDGSLVNVGNDARLNLIKQASLNYLPIDVSAHTTSTEFGGGYIDDDYLIIDCIETKPVLLIYTRNGNEYTYVGKKTLEANTGSKWSIILERVLKCGNYYYAIFLNSRRDEDSHDYFIKLAYTVDPTGAWRVKELVNSRYPIHSIYTDNIQVRIDTRASNAANPTVNSYTFSGDAQIVDSTVQSSVADFGFVDNIGHTAYAVGDGGFCAGGGLWGCSYKSNLTADWTVYDAPSWARSFNAIWYIGGKYWGLFYPNAEYSANNYNGNWIIGVADTLGTLVNNNNLSTLTHFTVWKNGVERVQRLDNGILCINTVDDKTEAHFVDTDGNMKSSTVADTALFGIYATYSSVKYGELVAPNATTNIIDVATPVINVEGCNAYMRIK